MNKAILTVVKIFISLLGLGLILFIFYDKLDTVFLTVIESDKNVLFFGVFCYVFINILSAYRLKTVLLMQNISISVMNAWKLNYLGYFFNLFMPSSIGGDIGKAYYIFKYSNKKGESFIGVFVDRIIGLFSVCFLCVLTLPFIYTQINNPLIPVIVCIFTLLVILIILLLTNKKLALLLQHMRYPIIPDKISSIVNKLFSLIFQCRNHPTIAFRAFSLSLVFQILSILSIYIVSQSINSDLTFMHFLLLMPLVYIFSMIPSINGIGVREGALIYFFTTYITVEKAIAFSLLFDIALYTCSFVGLFIYLFQNVFSKNKMQLNKVSFDHNTST